MKARVVRQSNGWVAVIRGLGPKGPATQALKTACARMRGDGIEAISLEVQDVSPEVQAPRAVRRPSGGS